MLVISRRVNQEVVIRVPGGHEIKVMVTEIRGTGKVKLGFTADKCVTVWRSEIQDDIDRRTGGV